MADKGRFEGLVVNFQNLPPKTGDAPLVSWLKWMGIGMLVILAANLLGWLI